MEVPRLHRQQKFCVSEAQHHKVIRKRPTWERKDDNIPEHVKEKQKKVGRMMDTLEFNPNDYRTRLQFMRSRV
eukprot:CAMPEP_0197063156 /NCGR_PEP_ID=MMETSP1384-20130603/150466_1 /TAXON_ID=29189 /ORGANISM="Ammonia sp." /LENGTH=72 /DNA_ID=CAMNT_0042499325 /DNA_START=1 /DNA_END=215 /DNA_ORIENTATION=-